jgi:hypothetical protein
MKTTFLTILLCCVGVLQAADESTAVVSFVKVVSDKVDDVSSMDASLASFIRKDATNEQKAIAIFNAVTGFVHHELYAKEYLTAPEPCVHDPIKAFNVYGHSHCCCTAAYFCAFARTVGMEARGWSTPGHSLSEVKYDDEWHMIDPAFINYFPKADGKIASVEELCANIGPGGRLQKPRATCHSSLAQARTAAIP